MGLWQFLVKLIILFCLLCKPIQVIAPVDEPRNMAKENFLCLATNIYFEAGNQSMKGKLAVKDVTINRGDNICDVIFKKKQFSWTHQKSWSTVKSFLDDRPKLSKLEMRVWNESKKAARSKKRVLSKDYTHFHTTDVKPVWTGKGTVIGKHKFLKGKK